MPMMRMTAGITPVSGIPRQLLLLKASSMKWAARMPMVIINWKHDTNRPRRAAGAIYSGAATALMPMAIPGITRAMSSSAVSGASDDTPSPR